MAVDSFQYHCLPVSSPLSGRNSDNEFDTPWLQEGNDFWQIEPWMPGAPLCGSMLTTQHVNSGLKALNEFHQTATRAVDLVGSDNWFHNAIRTSPAVQRRLRIVTELTSGLLDEMNLQLSVDPDIRFRSLANRVLYDFANPIAAIASRFVGNRFDDVFCSAGAA